MKYYPTLAEINTDREWLDVFKGYNHNLRIGEGEFYEMTNLSSDNYPLLSPRSKRGTYATPALPQGMVAKDSLCYIDGGDFVIGGDRVSMGLTVETDDEGKIIPKNLISMGAYVIVMPDKKYINTIPKEDEGGNRTYEFGFIEASVTTSSTVSFSLCKVDGADYENVTIKGEAPADPKNMDLWIDTSKVPHTLKQYSSTSAMWSVIATTYVKISAMGIGVPFEVNDGVRISGVEGEALAGLNTSAVIWAKGDNYIVVTGMLDEIATQEAPITVERRMPNMDFVIENENRLWGCRYGESIGGEMVNEIYVSKLGDFKNWNCFMGISTDSYVASVGTDGPFTGAIAHLGYPLFFKENCIHKVYGNYPANYQIQTTTCRGVQKGCERSLATVNEVLYYKARSGVCAYDGSLPSEISAALGEMSYSKAVAGSLGNKYYISMIDTEGAWHLFVCDTLKGMWHREDDTEAAEFCNCRGELYYIDRADNQIKAVKGAGIRETRPIRWSATTGVMGTGSPDKKYISRIDVRMKLDIGSRVSFYAEYDSSGEYEHLFTTPPGKNLRSFAVPIRPLRCDHMRLRIVGEGDAKIYSICKTIEWGSDV